MVVWLLAACGAVSPTSGSDASASRTTNPSASVAVPGGLFLVGNCTGPLTSANSTRTKPMGEDGITVAIPPGWTDHANGVGGESKTWLYLYEPTGYGPDNATFMVQQEPLPRQVTSSHKQADEDATG